MLKVQWEIKGLAANLVLSERILKISQHLQKFCLRPEVHVFFDSQCTSYRLNLTGVQGGAKNGQ